MTLSRPRRPLPRLLQYRVSTLLALIAVCAAGVCCVSSRAKQQQAAAELVEHLGGLCWYQHELEKTAPPGPERLRSLLGDHYFVSIVGVDLSHTQATDEMLAKLKGLTSLTELELYNTDITDVGLAHLSGLTNISSLDLHGTQVTDAGLVHIRSFTNLETLGLGRTQVTNAGLSHLEKTGDLRQLEIFGTRVTATGIKEFSRRRPNVVICAGVFLQGANGQADDPPK